MSDGNCVAEKSCGTGAATCDKSTGKATKCNGGYKLLSNGTCEICPAGTYAKAGSQVCSPCNDYYWSNPGSASCGRIQIKITYSHWNNNNEAGRTCAASKQQWFNAGTTVQCNNATFGDPAVGRGKGCGAECAHLSSEGQTIELGSCRKLPCDIYGRSGDRTIKLNADGTADGKGSGWSNTYSRVSSNMVRW